MDEAKAERKKRKSGIPTGNAGEYFVMGELLRRGYDAQLADRNTKGYDLVVGIPFSPHLQKVQVKTVRAQPWFVRPTDFVELPEQVTVYVMIGDEEAKTPIRYFIARNQDLAEFVHKPAKWGERDSAFMRLRDLKPFEGCWGVFREEASSSER